MLTIPYRSGPFKRRVLNKRLSQLSAGGKDSSKVITAGSQISTRGEGSGQFEDLFLSLSSFTQDPVVSTE